MKPITALAAAAAALSVHAAALAAVPLKYAGSQTFTGEARVFNGEGFSPVTTTATVDYAFTTDGTLGQLSSVNLTDWSVTARLVNREQDLRRTFSSGDGFSKIGLFAVGDGGLSATTEGLSFNFDGPFAMLEVGGQDTGTQRYDDSGAFNLSTVQEYRGRQVPGGMFLAIGQTQVIANFAGTLRFADLVPASGGPGGNPPVSAVPEPATWAMMILGFGLVGTAARRRRAPATVTA